MSRLHQYKYSWNFPSNNYGQIYGINDSGVETFKGTPIKSLAREICQNSLDAKLNNDEPVRIEFKTFEIATDDIPDLSSLNDAFERAKEFWGIQKSLKTSVFFENALEISSQEKVKCLRISDYNTTGLLGSDEEYNSPWCNLTKSQGASDKSGLSGGSFGIGKFAPFACSAFRTIIYSTLDSEGVEANQGVSHLTSFKNRKGETTQGTGFYGGDKNTPIKRQFSLEPGFERKSNDCGTDIFVIGFSHDEEWTEKMIASILDGFLYAVYTENLIVKIEDKTICKGTLSDLTVTYKSYLEEHADEYYQTLIEDEKLSPIYEDDIDTLGKVTLRLMIKPEYHRRVAMIRKTGMKIMDKGNINGLIPFAGVLYIEGDELNEFLRNLENPQHTRWEIERAENKTVAKRIITSLTRFIKNCLDELKNDDSEEAIDPSVGEYLPAEQQEEQNSALSTKESLSDIIKDISQKTVTLDPKSNDREEGDKDATTDYNQQGSLEQDDMIDNGEHSGVSNGENDSANDRKSGDANGATTRRKNKQIEEIAIEKTRVMCLKKSDGEYIITFVPAASADNAFLELYLSAESQNYGASLVSAFCTGNSNIEVKGKRIKNLTFVKNKPLKITIILEYHDYCSMEVKAYGNKK